MSTKQSGWEGTFLVFAIIFTVLIGSAYMIANVFRTPIPWLAIVGVSAVCAVGLRYIRRR
jgi:hypothetical protein